MSIYAFHSHNKHSGGAEFDITLELKHTVDNLTKIGGLPFKPTIGLLALCCNSEDPGFINNGNPTKMTNYRWTICIMMFIVSAINIIIQIVHL